MSHPVLDEVRRYLGRGQSAPLAARPAVPPARQANSTSEEIELLLREIQALSGSAAHMAAGDLDAALVRLVQEQEIKKACLWSTPRLADLGVERRLQDLGVQIIPGQADKRSLAQCDLGVTEVDFALPETGTLGLLASAKKPRAVSLLPRVHLAIVHPAALRADLQQVFIEAKDQHYLVFISGPSRTADIELTVTLGVHGPKALVVWVMDD